MAPKKGQFVEDDVDIDALKDSAKQIKELEEKIFEGDHLPVKFNGGIIKLCENLVSDVYEMGPISDNYHIDIEELIKKATASKFGLGTQTVYDPNVRNSLEIMADELDPKFIEKIKKNINIEKLANHCELIPHKLVIYQQGCFFKSHQDTIRNPRHIGTVSCILNSEFEGGNFVMRHNGNVESISCFTSVDEDNYNDDAERRKNNYWIAIYGDVFHEVERVTSGIRVSLLFDIHN